MVCACREVRKNNSLVLEAISAVDNIVEVHVAELLDLVAAMIGAKETHLGDQNFRLVNCRIAVETFG